MVGLSATTFSDTTTADIELGLDTFGDVTVDADGNRLGEAEVIRNVVDEAVLADRLGLDFFGVGEHHRDDFAVSSPETVLAAIAARTERIRLGSAVTVLSSDDPIRVYQRFATLDALSDGRAEVVLGRGSFTESFPLFGFPLDRYEELFEEKLDLFTHLLREEPITWSGTTRAPIPGLKVYPRTTSGLRTWVGVGGSPELVVRAARHGLPPMRAIIGGSSARFRPYVDLYNRAFADFGHEHLPVAVDPRRVRERGGPRRRAPRRFAGDRRPQDRDDCRGARREPLRHEVLGRDVSPRNDDAQHRAVRQRGRLRSTQARRLGSDCRRRLSAPRT